jgi:hypothetical protein
MSHAAIGNLTMLRVARASRFNEGRMWLPELLRACASVVTAALLQAAALGILPAAASVSLTETNPARTRPQQTQLYAENTTMIQSDIQERGKKLREQLSRVYDELGKAQKLSGGGTNISDALPPYIVPGMSFQEAEAVLRAAGFIIRPHPDLSKAADPNRATDWYGVLAVINPFKKLFLGHSDLYVTLLPKQPGDYSTVEKVNATVFVSTL